MFLFKILVHVWGQPCGVAVKLTRSASAAPGSPVQIDPDYGQQWLFFSESHVGCFLPHASVTSTEPQINPGRQERGVQEGKNKWKTGEIKGQLPFIGKKRNGSLSSQMRETGLWQGRGVWLSCAPWWARRSVQSLKWRGVCAGRPSCYIMNFDKPISQPGGPEEDVVLS